MTSPHAFNPARAIAVRVLTQVLTGERYAAPALDDQLTRHKLAPRDAGLTTHIVYGTLRHYITLDTALKPLLRGPTQTKVRALLLAGTFEKLILGTPSHAVVNEYVSLARKDFGRLSGFVNAVLRRAAMPELTPELEYSLPQWIIDEFRDAYGEQADAVMRDLLQPAPLWLWLTDEGIHELEQEEAIVEPGFGDVFRVTLARSLRTTRAYQQGHAQPINPASYAVVDALGNVAGQRVLDLAGGAGVKAAMLASRGANVTSVDVDGRKHRAAQENLTRLHLNATFVTADLRTPPELEPAPLVLLDAPCTGSGTLRAHPEIKLRLTRDATRDMADLQAQMLHSAAMLVAPGGRLVYSVCSITGEEGPDVVSRFLQDHPNFEATGVHVGVPAVQDDFGQRTLATNGLDGFYISTLTRSDDA